MLIWQDGRGHLSYFFSCKTPIAPSLGVLADTGDANHNIETLAKSYNIYVGNYGSSQRVLPQLSQPVRSEVRIELQNIADRFLYAGGNN
ncbi:hypothetical protein N480_14040 [Pseudoalteromonas luteoviolacea S2607]|uniref:hypothetical protein n=1 Tax=Pseudoalteromonas luteoviolacea TaxID=43657 RepID=UPI0007B05672|nr:hypothetical protein [Pseudoalteromonas luteoviolacea]KZN37859.1 hypothetical protein N480_14040 [Pseudoalteromonas luteoviolacea S2607]